MITLKTHCKRGHEYAPENTYIASKSGIRSCLSCRTAYSKMHPKVYNSERDMGYRNKWLKKNPTYFKELDLRTLYGLTLEQYNEKLKAQDGKCAICKKVPIKFNVDHDHNCCSITGRKRVDRKTCGKCVRGLLCDGCNTALGRFKDSEEILQRAIDYLREYKNAITI